MKKDETDRKKQEKWWKRGKKPMKNDEQERTKTRTHYEKERTNNETWWKREKKQWKMVKKRKNNEIRVNIWKNNSEKWWKIETKQWKMMQQRKKTMKHGEK